MFNKLKKFLKSKRAVGSVATAIKVGTACVLGATVLVGGVALTNDVVLPNTSDKVNNVAEYEGDGTGGSTGGVTPVSVPVSYNHDDPALHPTGTVPEGCRYISDSAIYNGGDSMPSPQIGDGYETADYVYVYGKSNYDYSGYFFGVPEFDNDYYLDLLEIYECSDIGTLFTTIVNVEGFDSGLDGWTVVGVKNRTKESYEPILESINGKPVVELYGTFWNCIEMSASPIIPRNIISMNSTFDECTTLTTAPTIPSSVTDMSYTFHGCTSLTTAPTIPSSVTNMESAFGNCATLTTAPTIPSSVTNMSYTFKGCTSIKTYIGSADSDGDFSHYIIPSSVVEMNSAFFNCTFISVAPAIPSSIAAAENAFSFCTALTGEITIPVNCDMNGKTAGLGEDSGTFKSGPSWVRASE